MRRATIVPDSGLERELLRKGIGTRTAGQPHCHDCRRTPLTGERVYRYDDGRLACELCRDLRLQEPAASYLVRGGEHGQTVRLRVRAAA